VRIYDISLPLQASLAPWPGDTPYSLAVERLDGDGTAIHLGAVTMSVHSGSHADAPFHFLERGASMEAVDLHAYLGPAVVIDLAGRAVIRRADLAGVDFSRAPRALLKTGAWPDPAVFPAQVPVMAPDVPAFLQERGVVLVGVDVPSVDTLDSKELPVHRALAAAGIAILESLRLADVPSGEYELLALPLRLVGADGSPVRAILRSGIETPNAHR
jgi:arylformamidase